MFGSAAVGQGYFGFVLPIRIVPAGSSGITASASTTTIVHPVSTSTIVHPTYTGGTDAS